MIKIFMSKKFRIINQRMKKILEIFTVLIICQTFTSSAEENKWTQNEVLLSKKFEHETEGTNNNWKQNEILLNNKIEHEKEGARKIPEFEKSARLTRNVDGWKERFQDKRISDKNLGRSSRSPESASGSNRSDYRCAYVRIFYRSVKRYSKQVLSTHSFSKLQNILVI